MIFKLVIVGAFLVSAAGTAAFFKLSGVSDHPGKTIRVSAVRQDSAPVQLTYPHQNSGALSYVESELARAKSLMNGREFAEAEAVYKQLLNNHELLEIHDPLRIAVCQQYAELLTTLGRNEEAQRILDDSKHIHVKPAKDNHPARAHIS